MGHPTPPTGKDRTLTAAMVICLLLGIGMFYGFSQSVVPPQPVGEAWFGFSPIEIDDARLKRERAAQVEGKDLTSAKEDIARLHATIRKGNLLQFQPIVAQRTLKINAEAEFAANDIITRIGGIEGFVDTSAPLTHACQTHVETLLSDIQNKKITVELATSKPPMAEYQAYAEACGNVLKLLHIRGVVTDAGEWQQETGPIIMELLGRLRYAYILNLRAPAWSQLTDYERQILWRWRIEDEHAYTYKERLDFANQVDSGLLGYDPEIARGRLYFSNGFKKDARTTFEALCKKHPTDRQLGEACTWLEENVPYEEPRADGAPHDF